MIAKINFIFILVFIVMSSATLSSAFLAPEPAPVVSASEAAILVEKAIKKLEEDSGFYVDRMWLLPIDRERVWIVSVASPAAGFRFFRVRMNKAVSELTNREAVRVLRAINGVID